MAIPGHPGSQRAAPAGLNHARRRPGPRIYAGAVRATAERDAALGARAAVLAGLRKSGLPLALVHGGGKDINRHLAWLQEEPVFKDGLRVTGPAAMKVVEMTLSGYVNKKLVGLLNVLPLVWPTALGLATFLLLIAPLGVIGNVISGSIRPRMVPAHLLGALDEERAGATRRITDTLARLWVEQSRQ